MAQALPANLRHKIPIISITLVCLSILVTTSSNLTSLFVLDRGAVVAGDWWRLFVFPFVHFGPVHLIYNMLALGVAGWIVERWSRFRFVLLIFLAAPVIGSWLIAYEPGMALYGGMSAIVFSMTIYGALAGRERIGLSKHMCTLITIFLPVKVMWEFHREASILPYGEYDYFVVMPSSHAVGIAIGLIFYVFMPAKRQNWSEIN